MMIMMMMMYRSQVNQMMTDQNCCVRAVTQQFTPSLCTGNIIISLHVHVYRGESELVSIEYSRSLTVSFFLYWCHCKCLATLVGPVHMLSAVMFL